MPRASAVVPGQADAEPIVIHANHTDMVKYTSKSDSGYSKISEVLQIMTEEAPESNRLRWQKERKIDERGHTKAARIIDNTIP